MYQFEGFAHKRTFVLALMSQLTSYKVLSLPTVMVANTMWQVLMWNNPTSARTTQTTRKGKLTSRRRKTLVVAVPVLDWIGSTNQQNGGNWTRKSAIRFLRFVMIGRYPLQQELMRAVQLKRQRNERKRSSFQRDPPRKTLW
jgi:hypothetical protein